MQLRWLLTIAAFCACINATLLLYRDFVAQRGEGRELILVYYEPDPPFPGFYPKDKPILQYPSLWDDDPARSWRYGAPYLASAVYRCGVRRFFYSGLGGLEATGWSNGVSKEVVRIPLRFLTSAGATCVIGLIDPPHVKAALPVPNQTNSTISRMLRSDPPL